MLSRHQPHLGQREAAILTRGSVLSSAGGEPPHLSHGRHTSLHRSAAHLRLRFAPGANADLVLPRRPVNAGASVARVTMMVASHPTHRASPWPLVRTSTPASLSTFNLWTGNFQPWLVQPRPPRPAPLVTPHVRSSASPHRIGLRCDPTHRSLH